MRYVIVSYIILPPLSQGEGLGVRLLSNNSRFPASGFRFRELGTLGSLMGREGYTWTSSSSFLETVYVSCLGIASTVVNPLSAVSAAHGVPVRCVQAFTITVYMASIKSGVLQSTFCSRVTL